MIPSRDNQVRDSIAVEIRGYDGDRRREKRVAGWGERRPEFEAVRAEAIENVHGAVVCEDRQIQQPASEV
jgi:hypothetical protein